MRIVIFILIFMTSCSKRSSQYVELPNDNIEIIYRQYKINFRDKELIIHNANIFEPQLKDDTIKLGWNKIDTKFLNDIYLENKMYDINGYMEEENYGWTDMNFARIIINNEPEIFISENYANIIKNKKVIKYLYQLNKYLDKKLEKDSLYQKNIEKIKGHRRL